MIPSNDDKMLDDFNCIKYYVIYNYLLKKYNAEEINYEKLLDTFPDNLVDAIRCYENKLHVLELIR